MPMYDFICPHRHAFEFVVPMAERDQPVPCQGTVNQLVEEGQELPPEIAALPIVTVNIEEVGDVQVRQVPCMLKATRAGITHSNPMALLDHGLARHRDAAREGRYDPLRRITRGVGR